MAAAEETVKVAYNYEVATKSSPNGIVILDQGITTFDNKAQAQSAFNEYECTHKQFLTKHTEFSFIIELRETNGEISNLLQRSVEGTMFQTYDEVLPLEEAAEEPQEQVLGEEMAAAEETVKTLTF